MKLIQFHLPNLGRRVGIVTRDEAVIDVTSEESPGVLEVLTLAHQEQVSLGVILADIQEKVAPPRADATPFVCRCRCCSNGTGRTYAKETGCRPRRKCATPLTSNRRSRSMGMRCNLQTERRYARRRHRTRHLQPCLSRGSS